MRTLTLSDASASELWRALNASTAAPAVAASPAAAPVASPPLPATIQIGPGVFANVSAVQSDGGGRLAYIVPGTTPPQVIWYDPDPGQAASDAAARAARAARTATIAPDTRTPAQYWGAILNTTPTTPAMFQALAMALGEDLSLRAQQGGTTRPEYDAIADESGSPFVAAIAWMRAGNQPGAGPDYSVADLDKVKALLASVGA
jgi:hypothetical protein